MRTLGSFLRQRPIWVTLLVLAGLAVFEIATRWQGAAKLADLELRDDTDRVHIAVHMPFEPEHFHMTRLQERGRLIRVEEGVAYLMDVAVADVRDLAQRYWISDIESWKGM